MCDSCASPRLREHTVPWSDSGSSTAVQVGFWHASFHCGCSPGLSCVSSTMSLLSEPLRKQIPGTPGRVSRGRQGGTVVLILSPSPHFSWVFSRCGNSVTRACAVALFAALFRPHSAIPCRGRLGTARSCSPSLDRATTAALHSNSHPSPSRPALHKACPPTIAWQGSR